jgi:hypothetical protein
MTNKITVLNQKEINMTSGGLSKKIIDLTDVTAGLALGGIATLFAPAIVGGAGVALIGFGVSCVSFWAIPIISAALTKTPKPIKPEDIK